jgi:hypothetical protein
MLKTRSLIASVKLEPKDLTPALIVLSEKGWSPAILESGRFFVDLTGVKDKLDVRELRQPIEPSSFSRNYLIEGDIFFRDFEVYYVVVNPRNFITDQRGIRIRVHGNDEDELTLEIGVVSSRAEGLPERVQEFAELIEEAIKATIDGRKARYMDFGWREVKPGTPHLDHITDIDEEESGAKFALAELIPEHVEAAGVLSDKLNRNLLVELLRAGFGRAQDVLSRRAKQEEIKKALTELESSGLIQSEFLLECNKMRNPLTRLSSRKQLEEPGVANLICPSCGSPFSEEILSEGYSASELGRRMTKQSHWMTVWTTDLLVQLGIPVDSILWNISENGEEVDLLVEFLGRSWIFELKDREFGAGDAHPLNYRQVRYQADRAIIFTTEKVSKDAKRVFDELQREVDRSNRFDQRKRSKSPLYIEGLEKAEEMLRKEVSEVSLSYAHSRLALIGRSSGYNLGSVLSARFGETVDLQVEIDDDIPF